MSAIGLRTASIEDLAFLYELYVSTRDGEFEFLPDPQCSQLLRFQFNAQQAGYASQFPGSEQMIILKAGEAVGQIRLARTEDGIRIVDISVLPQHRRLGIGAAVYRHVLSEAAAANKMVVASVLQSNAESLQFHVRCGFSITGHDGIYFTLSRNNSGTD